MNGWVWYTFGNPLKVRFRKHFCSSCNHELSIIKHYKVVNSESEEAKYYDFPSGEIGFVPGDVEFIHKIFYCPKCEKRTEFVTQLSYEDHEKWVRKAYDKLLKLVKPAQISKVYIDNNNQQLFSVSDFENVKSIDFLVDAKGKLFFLPCCVIEKAKIWERPLRIKKDKHFRKALKEMKNSLSKE